MVAPPSFELPLPEAHYAALGKVANTWADLERVLDYCCAALIGCEVELAYCLTAQMIGPGKKLDALLALMNYRAVSRDVYDRMKKLGGHIQGLGEKRNRCLHDPWNLKAVLEEGFETLMPDDDKLGAFAVASLLTGIRVPKVYAPHRFELTARKVLVHEHKRIETDELLRLVEQIAQAIEDVFATVADALNELDVEGQTPAQGATS